MPTEIAVEVDEEKLPYRERYKVAYRVDYAPEGKTPEELLSNNLGGTDVLIIASIIKEENGSSSTAIVSMDGETGDRATSEDMFKAWVILAKMLAEDERLGLGRRMFARQTWETVRDMILEARKKEGPP